MIVAMVVALAHARDAELASVKAFTVPLHALSVLTCTPILLLDFLGNHLL